MAPCLRNNSNTQTFSCLFGDGIFPILCGIVGNGIFFVVLLSENETPTQLAEKIRSEIKEATGCTASVGIGSNILLSRMCTRVAKPDGCFSIPPTHDVNQFMGESIT